MPKPDEIKNLYQQYYRRDPTAEEYTGWSTYAGTDFNKSFADAVKANLPSDAYNLPYSNVNPTGYTVMAPKDWETEIKRQYEAKMPEIESGIKSAAAGGGLDTGGYQTSLAKAKTASWSDMLSNIMGYKQQQESMNWQKQLPFIQRSWESEDWTKQENLAKWIAKTNKPTDTEKGLGYLLQVLDIVVPG